MDEATPVPHWVQQGSNCTLLFFLFTFAIFHNENVSKVPNIPLEAFFWFIVLIYLLEVQV